MPLGDVFRREVSQREKHPPGAKMALQRASQHVARQ